MEEPYVKKATVRVSIDENDIENFDIECRFSDGQKFSAVEVDGEHETLAHCICDFLNGDTHLKYLQKEAAYQMVWDAFDSYIFERNPDTTTEQRSKMILKFITNEENRKSFL